MRSIRPRAWEIRLRAVASHNSPCWRQITRRLQYDWIIRKGETWWPPTVLCAPAGVSLVTKLPQFISQKCFFCLSASQRLKRKSSLRKIMLGSESSCDLLLLRWPKLKNTTRYRLTVIQLVVVLYLVCVKKKAGTFAWAQKIIPQDVFTKPYWNKWITQQNTLNTPS